jgi:hypothetical protein
MPLKLSKKNFILKIYKSQFYIIMARIKILNEILVLGTQLIIFCYQAIKAYKFSTKHA